MSNSYRGRQKVYNPKTGRYVFKTGTIGKNLTKKTSKSTKPKKTLKKKTPKATKPKKTLKKKTPKATTPKKTLNLSNKLRLKGPKTFNGTDMQTNDIISGKILFKKIPHEGILHANIEFGDNGLSDFYCSFKTRSHQTGRWWGHANSIKLNDGTRTMTVTIPEYYHGDIDKTEKGTSATFKLSPRGFQKVQRFLME